MKGLFISNGKFDWKSGWRSFERKFFIMVIVVVIVSGVWLKRINFDMVDFVGVVEEGFIRSGFFNCFFVVFFWVFIVFYY